MRPSVAALAATALTVPALGLVGGSAAAAGDRLDVAAPRTLGVAGRPTEFVALVDNSVQRQAARVFFTVTPVVGRLAPDTLTLEYLDPATRAWRPVALTSAGPRLTGSTGDLALPAGRQQLRYRLAARDLDQATGFKELLERGVTLRSVLAETRAGQPVRQLATDTDRIALAEPSLEFVRPPATLPTGLPSEMSLRLRNPTDNRYGPVRLAVQFLQSGAPVRTARLEWFNPALAVWQRIPATADRFELFGPIQRYALDPGYDRTYRFRLTLPKDAVAAPGSGSLQADLYRLNAAGRPDRQLAATGRALELTPGSELAGDQVAAVSHTGADEDRTSMVDVAAAGQNSRIVTDTASADGTAEPAMGETARLAGYGGLMLAAVGGMLFWVTRRRPARGRRAR